MPGDLPEHRCVEISTSDQRPTLRRRFLLSFVIPCSTAGVALIACYWKFVPLASAPVGPDRGAGYGILGALGVLLVFAILVSGGIGGILGALVSVLVGWKSSLRAVLAGFASLVVGVFAGVLVLYVFIKLLGL